jgi:hypothetical protein
MRKFSRWMPPVPVQRPSIWGWLFLALLLALFFFGFVAMYLEYPSYSLIVLGAFVMIVAVGSVLGTRYMRRLAAARTDESICTFVRSFDYRRTDPWVLRAVYEELSRQLVVDGRPLPIRADDRWAEDLKLDPDDFDEFVMDIAHRAGRSMDNTERNPFCGRVKTVRDLVRFLEHQPRTEAARQVSAANGASPPC